LTLLVGRQEGHPACKKEWWGAGMVVCLERGADLHMVQLMPLSLTISSVKSRLVLPFWYRLTWVVPEKGPLKWVCVPFSCQRRINVKIKEQCYVDSTSTREGYLNHTAKVTLMLTERSHDSPLSGV